MKRLILGLLLLCYLAVLTGCSFWADFVLVNNSGETLKVRYKLHETEAMPLVFPMLSVATIEQFEESNTFNRLPNDRFEVDAEKRSYSVTLNDQEVLFLTRTDIRDIDDEPVFKSGMSELSIESQTGLVSFSGDQVFPQFVPQRKALFPTVPTLYTITFK